MPQHTHARNQGSSKLQDAIPLPYEFSDHGIHYQSGPVSRRLHDEWGTHWGMLVQEGCPAHICGHHGHCLTHLRDLDGYAFEATYLPT